MFGNFLFVQLFVIKWKFKIVFPFQLYTFLHEYFARKILVNGLQFARGFTPRERNISYPTL